MTTFSAWLRLQRDREDPVGDLARDFIEGTLRGHHGRTYRTVHGFRRMLDRVGASPLVYLSLDRASAEFDRVTAV